MKLIPCLVIPMAAAMLIALPAAAPAQSFPPDQRHEIENIAHPAVAARRHKAARQAAEGTAAEKARTTIKANNAAIFNAPHEVVLGNPHGNVSIVEFFDYNCGYCKHALPAMMKLLQTDTNLRFVLKELPILGEDSVEAAHVAVAARMQHPAGAKIIEFYQKLLGGRGAANKARALAVAKEVGYEMGQLMKDMDSDEVRTTIAEDIKLADTLGIEGTPSYVVGDELVVGTVGYDELAQKIAALRK